MSKRIHVTTVDNPFDPFENFDEWLHFDIEKGYYSGSKLARLMTKDEFLTEDEENEEIEKAIDRLIEIDPLDLYRKVVKET